MQKVIFIGAGSMAEALIHGWIKKNVINPHALFISNRSNKERLKELVESYDVNLLEDHTQLQDADLVILAMKPKDARAAMEIIAPHLGADTAIISVLAGVTIETIEQYLGSRSIARVMPNTSATIGMSASGIAFNQHVTEVQRALYIQ
ncbi:MAG: NAD(P)-binding domain-containing protein, partial [Solibacillus isronensis]